MSKTPDDEEERLARPDGHRYEAPASEEETENQRVDVLILGIVVVVLMVLVATGIIPIYNW